MLGIIGGTGLYQFDSFENIGTESIATPYGTQDVLVSVYQHQDRKLAFLPRHGKDHVLPPHRINYRANIWALHQLDVTEIVAVNAVGGIHENLGPGNFAVPDQIIDYTSGRNTSFFDTESDAVQHIDFTIPYAAGLRNRLLISCSECCQSMAISPWVMDGGVYGCTNGPRLETAAEIKRLQRDGCDMVGMTGMPEAALARELGLAYASLALSVNWAAGFTSSTITMDEIHAVLKVGVRFINRAVQELVNNTG